MESQQPLTAPMVNQFMQMLLREKRKTKFAVRKYKDLKNTSNDKKSTLATQQVTVPKTVATTPRKTSVKKDLKTCGNVPKTTQKKIAPRGRVRTTSGNDDTTVSGTNQAGPTLNTLSQVAAQQAASTGVVLTSYQGTVAAILPDVIEEEEGESEDDSINQLCVVDSESEEYSLISHNDYLTPSSHFLKEKV